MRFKDYTRGARRTSDEPVRGPFRFPDQYPDAPRGFGRGDAPSSRFSPGDIGREIDRVFETVQRGIDQFSQDFEAMASESFPISEWRDDNDSGGDGPRAA